MANSFKVQRHLYSRYQRSPIATRQLGALGAGSNPFTAANASSAVGAGASFVKSKNPTVNYAAQGAAYGSTFGPIGTAVGAVVGAIGGAFIGSKRPESELWDNYKKMAGNASGHEYDNAFRNGAFVGLMRLGKNTFPPRAKGGYGPNDDARFIRDMTAKIADAFRSGALTPDNANTDDIYNRVVAPWIAQWGEEKNADWRKWENQIVKDQIDAWLYDQPTIATSYSTATWPQPRVTDLAKEILAKYAPATPAPINPAPVTPAPVKTVTPVTGAPNVAVPNPIAAGPIVTDTGQPAAVVPAAPVPTSAADPNLKAYIDALIAAGANQQQAFNAAMAALSNAGVPPTPEAQQQVAAQVQAAGTGQGLPTWATVLAIGGLMFALARPVGKSRRGKRR